MTRQAPLGPEDMNCPKWLEPMSKVCHKCPLWTAVGDEWTCGLAWQTPLIVRLIGEVQLLGKEINVLRNETKASSDRQQTMAAIAVQRARGAIVETLDLVGVPRAIADHIPHALLEEPKTTNGHDDG